MTTALEGGEVSASRPGRSLPPGKTRYPLYRGWVGTDEYQEYFMESKGDRCVELTTLPLICADCLKIWERQPPGTLRACNRAVQVLLYPFLHSYVRTALSYFCVVPSNVLNRPWPYAVRVEGLCVCRTERSSPNLSLMAL
jgi:hypothetical protein